MNAQQETIKKLKLGEQEKWENQGITKFNNKMDREILYLPQTQIFQSLYLCNLMV